VYILGFNMPQLAHKKDFVSRIVRADYDDGKHFLADKYSDYYIELGKLSNWKKSDLPEQYHELWDLCVILNTKIKDQERVIKMQAVQSPLALEFAKEVRSAVAPMEFVDETMRRERELKELRNYLFNQEQKAAAKAAEEARKAAAKATKQAAIQATQETAESMIIIAIQNNAPPAMVEAMQKGARITDERLDELRKQAKPS
jgi:hypothetical protein